MINDIYQIGLIKKKPNRGFFLLCIRRIKKNEGQTILFSSKSMILCIRHACMAYALNFNLEGIIMKKIGLLLLGLMLALTLTACGGNGENTSDSPDSNNTQSYMDYFAMVEVGDTLAQVEEKIGTKGEETNDSKYSTIYFWDVADGNGVEVTFNKEDGKADKVKMEYEAKDISNEKTKVKDLEGLKAKINDGITYDDVKAWVGGTDGVLYEKTKTANSYYWRGTDGSSLMANFSAETGLCTSYTGFGN